MAPKTSSNWNDAAFLHDLVVTFYEVGTEANVLTADMRKDIASHPTHSVYFCFKMPRQVMRWDERVHEDILLAVFNHVSFTNDQMAKIMDELRAREYTFTENALRQHIQKLRRTQDSPEKSAKNGAVASTPTKSTPKRKARTSKGTPAKSAAAAESYEDDEINFKLESYEEDEHDSKRLKNEAE